MKKCFGAGNREEEIGLICLKAFYGPDMPNHSKHTILKA